MELAVYVPCLCVGLCVIRVGLCVIRVGLCFFALTFSRQGSKLNLSEYLTK